MLVDIRPAALQDLGLHLATDVVGGFAAWRMAGLPAFGPTDVCAQRVAAPPPAAAPTPH